MTTKIFDFEFLAPVPRDHVIVVALVQNSATQTVTDFVVDQTAGVTYCSDLLHAALWSDDAALQDPLALLGRQGWKTLSSRIGRVVSSLVSTRNDGESNFVRTRVMTTPVTEGSPYR